MAVYNLDYSEIEEIFTIGGEVKINDVVISQDTDLYVDDVVSIILPDGYVWGWSNPRFFFTDGWNYDYIEFNTSANEATVVMTSQEWNGFELGDYGLPDPNFTLLLSDVNSIINAGGEVKVNNVAITQDTDLFVDDVISINLPDGSMWETPSKLVAFDGWGSEEFQFTIDGNNSNITILDEEYTDLVLGSYEIIEITPDYLYSNSDDETFTGAGVKLYINDVLASVGAGINVGDVLTAIAEDDREFYEISIDGELKPSIYFKSYYNNHYFDVLNNNEATLIFPSKIDTWDNYIEFEVFTKQESDLVGFNNAYLIDLDKLSILNDVRFKTIGGDSEGNTTVYDYGQYILGLIEIPYKIPDEYIGLTENINLGNFNTEISTEIINSDYIEFNLGKIVIPEPDNLLNYENTTAKLYLPYIEAINIDLEFIWGYELEIIYRIDVYSGNATVNIISNKNNSTIITKVVDIGIKIPYSNNDNINIENSGIELGGNNNIDIPFIEILTNDSVLSDGVFTIPIVDEKTLSDESGYIEVENIDLVGRIKLSDRQRIINLLNNGVIIK